MRLQCIAQAGDLVGAFRDGDAGAFEVGADRLRAAAQALAQEAFGHCVEGLAVFRALEAVAFVGEQHVGDRDVLGFHRVDDLVAFGLFDAWVVGALADQQRLADLVDVGERGAFGQPLLAGDGGRVAHALGQLLSLIHI